MGSFDSFMLTSVTLQTLNLVLGQRSEVCEQRVDLGSSGANVGDLTNKSMSGVLVLVLSLLWW